MAQIQTDPVADQAPEDDQDPVVDQAPEADQVPVADQDPAVDQALVEREVNFPSNSSTRGMDISNTTSSWNLLQVTCASMLSRREPEWLIIPFQEENSEICTEVEEEEVEAEEGVEAEEATVEMNFKWPSTSMPP